MMEPAMDWGTSMCELDEGGDLACFGEALWLVFAMRGGTGGILLDPAGE